MKVNLDLEGDIIVGWTSYPLDEAKPVYDIPDNTLEYITQHLGHITTSYVLVETEEIVIQNKKDRINELKALLASTDYKAIKYAEGLISEYDYIPVKQQRQEWRNKINELEGELGGY